MMIPQSTPEAAQQRSQLASRSPAKVAMRPWPGSVDLSQRQARRPARRLPPHASRPLDSCPLMTQGFFTITPSSTAVLRIARRGR